jgi:hypothetical protein
MSMQADPPQGKTINLLTGLLVGRTGRAGRMWSPRCSYMESTR